eukprot:gb/GEZN01008862.1/.p1 GENE.gb/GEZN01008862.1/~~gb/GEZN01008862.1/.p1  ORF type:complete len:412 (-),score=13.43 gb/GEZN01008862.1/:147-1301(-)
MWPLCRWRDGRNKEPTRDEIAEVRRRWIERASILNNGDPELLDSLLAFRWALQERHVYVACFSNPLGYNLTTVGRLTIITTILLFQMMITSIFYGSHTNQAVFTVGFIAALSVIIPSALLNFLFERTHELSARGQFEYDVRLRQTKVSHSEMPPHPFIFAPWLNNLGYYVSLALCIMSAVLMLAWGVNFDFQRGEVAGLLFAPSTFQTGHQLQLAYLSAADCHAACLADGQCMGISFRKRDCACILTARGGIVLDPDYSSEVVKLERDNSQAWVSAFIISVILDIFVIKPLLLLCDDLYKASCDRKVPGVDLNSIEIFGVGPSGATRPRVSSEQRGGRIMKYKEPHPTRLDARAGCQGRCRRRDAWPCSERTRGRRRRRPFRTD